MVGKGLVFAVLTSLPLILGANEPPPARKPQPQPQPRPKASPYGDMMVKLAIQSLGIKEDSTAVRSWCEAMGIDAYNGPPPWCAIAVCYWMREASARLKVAMPVPGSAHCKTMLAQFQKAGRALDANATRNAVLSPGTVLIWDRSDPPHSGPQGHTGIVESDTGAGWLCIEGNTISDDVRRVLRSRNDGRLVGAGLVD